MYAQSDSGHLARLQAMKTVGAGLPPAMPFDAASRFCGWAPNAEGGLAASADELEANECAAYRSLFEVGAALFGELAFQVDSSAGATAFVSPLIGKPGVFNRVLGLGLRSPPRPADLVGLMEHFRHAGAVPAFDLLQSHVDRGAAEALRALRIRRAATSVVLHKRLDAEVAAEPLRAPTVGLRVTQAQGAQCRVVATICAEVFGMPNTVLSLLQALQDEPDWQLWLALVDGRPAGAALSYTHGGACWFGWAATLPAFRGRGVKGALDEARLAAAQDEGCAFVSSDTGIGTSVMPDHSLRSLLRRGFSPSHLRSTYLPAADGPG